MRKFTQNSTLKEVLETKDGERILAKYRLPCLGCPMIQFEMKDLTLEKISQLYKINLKNLLKELNNQRQK